MGPHKSGCGRYSPSANERQEIDRYHIDRHRTAGKRRPHETTTFARAYSSRPTRCWDERARSRSSSIPRTSAQKEEAESRLEEKKTSKRF